MQHYSIINMPYSFDNLRLGKTYRMKNFDEEVEFQVEDISGFGDFKLKDIHTLERFTLKDFLQFGKGKDFNIHEI